MAFNAIRHWFNHPYSRYPIAGAINITHRCNFDCNFCCYGFNKKEKRIQDISDQDFERCLNIDAFKYTLIIGLGSGEPLLHAHLPLFIKLIKSKNKLVNIITNGSLIHKRFEELMSAPPDLLWVSLYDGHENLQLENLKLLSSSKIQTVLGFSKLISKTNIKNIPMYIDLARQANISNIFFQQYYGDTDHILYNLIRDTDEDEVGYLKDLAKKSFFGMNVTLPNPIPSISPKCRCDFIFKGFSIEPNGAIQPCCFIHTMGRNTYGNLFENEDAHFSNPAYMHLKKSFGRSHRELLPMCKACYAVNLR